MKKTKGISLIVLVITIIIMIILSGTVVLTLNNSEIITKAKDAVELQNKAIEKQRLELVVAEMMLKNNGKTTIDEYIQKLLEEDLIEANVTTNNDGSKTVTTKSGYIVKIEQEGANIKINFEQDVNTDLESGEKEEVEGGDNLEGEQGGGNVDDEQGKEEDTIETISKTESYVGYYADIDGDKVADGIIYADLAVGGSGNWNSQESYSYSAIEGVKDYYISGTHNGDFRNGKEVLTAIGEGNDRFYVMALSDYTQNTTNSTWESKLDENYSDSEILNDYGIPDIESTMITETGFGEGRTNTENLIKKFNSSSESNNLWVAIRSLHAEGWFIPSKTEWLAFLGNLSVPTTGSMGLSGIYWTSSEGYLRTSYE